MFIIYNVTGVPQKSYQVNFGNTHFLFFAWQKSFCDVFTIFLNTTDFFVL